MLQCVTFRLYRVAKQGFTNEGGLGGGGGTAKYMERHTYAHSFWINIPQFGCLFLLT